MDDDTKIIQWLDWHSDKATGAPSDNDQPYLRKFEDGRLVAEVALTAGEMASVGRKFDQKVATEKAGEIANDLGVG